MMSKLRTFLAALLLVPVLTSNASAFTTDIDDAFGPLGPRSDVCYWYWNGIWYRFEC